MERNQQIKELQVLVEDEILLLKYEPEYKHLGLAIEIRKKWDANRDIQAFNRWLVKKFQNLVPSFVSLTDADNVEAINETLILRFLTLTIVILALSQNLEQGLKSHRLFKGEQSEKINQVVSFAIEFLITSAFPEFLKKLQKFTIPRFLQSWIWEFQTTIQNFLKVRDLQEVEAVLDEIYLVYEFVTDFLDYLDQTEFEIEDFEILELNQVLNQILYVHGILYNLLLVIEKVFDLEEEHKEIQLMLNKELLEEHDTRLEMMKLLANEPWN